MRFYQISLGFVATMMMTTFLNTAPIIGSTGARNVSIITGVVKGSPNSASGRYGSGYDDNGVSARSISSGDSVSRSYGDSAIGDAAGAIGGAIGGAVSDAGAADAADSADVIGGVIGGAGGAGGGFGSSNGATSSVEKTVTTITGGSQ